MRIQSEPGVAPEGFIPLAVPVIRGNEWQYVKECLDTGWVSSVGPFVDQFEAAVATQVGTRHAIATVNGTSALHIALIVAGVKPGDEVLLSTLTFIAPANAIRYVGAWPVFIDAEPKHWQMDPQRVADFLEEQCRWANGELRNRSTGRKIAAILPVHILGHPVDMEPLLVLARKYHLPVIEDATESLGARYKNNTVGHLGDIACFSFNGNKIITTGGGGMITTDNEDWARRAKYLTTQAKDDPIEYIHHEVGFNYRLTNIQAALGCAQMEQLGTYISAKRRIAKAYTERLQGINGIEPMREADWAWSIFWMFTIQIDCLAFGHTSRELLQHVGAHRIQARPLWQPMHQSPAYSQAQAWGGEVANGLYANCLSLPCSVHLQEEEIDRVCKVVIDSARKATR